MFADTVVDGISLEHMTRLNELKSNAENSVTVDTLNNCLDNKANKQIFLNQKLEEIQMTEFKEKEVQKMLDQLNSEITEERRNAVRKIIKLEEETVSLRVEFAKRLTQGFLFHIIFLLHF
ncbi:unnamed protein product [Trichobilharzia regenti]|nr:unnamed protein product [Trichobilharzia regenti]